MYLWDANIVRHFGEGHPNLAQHIHRVGWEQIALPTPVIAEVMRGRSEHALKSTPQQAILAHQLLVETYNTLQNFETVIFNSECAEIMESLQHKKSTKKRYVDCMIAATVICGEHILITRNQKHFRDLLPNNQIENWIDG